MTCRIQTVPFYHGTMCSSRAKPAGGRLMLRFGVDHLAITAVLRVVTRNRGPSRPPAHSRLKSRPHTWQIEPGPPSLDALLALKALVTDSLWWHFEEGCLRQKPSRMVKYQVKYTGQLWTPACRLSRNSHRSMGDQPSLRRPPFQQPLQSGKV